MQKRVVVVRRGSPLPWILLLALVAAGGWWWSQSRGESQIDPVNKILGEPADVSEGEQGTPDEIRKRFDEGSPLLNVDGSAKSDVEIEHQYGGKGYVALKGMMEEVSRHLEGLRRAIDRREAKSEQVMRRQLAGDLREWKARVARHAGGR